ncbi:Imm5 family immunity protein [Hahella sp. CR1]|uniref:Imm5 family immunity protein n=1 Tax=Hahella sp. CR1 TaxID=2992807 RepID=UPI002441DACC|nr:Imm5 family immunity protein [Hahella sp. CR1]MDG9671811.1 Imm5 family immunity protein [Hahella sp. CR1]
MLPKELNDQIAKAKAYLTNDPHGDLPLHQRAPILRLLGDGREDMKAPYPSYLPGHIRRYTLMKMCAEKVFFVWENYFQIDRTPQITLGESDKYIQRGFPPTRAEVKPLINRLLACVENDPDAGAAAMPGWAAAYAFLLSESDTDIWTRDDAATMEDLDSEIYGWTGDFNASLAYANGPVGNDDSDDSKRREFWEWYLNQAVEEAYESVS